MKYKPSGHVLVGEIIEYGDDEYLDDAYRFNILEKLKP